MPLRDKAIFSGFLACYETVTTYQSSTSIYLWQATERSVSGLCTIAITLLVPKPKYLF